ncbi:hypothetical protein MPC4_80166 [Methylocella tundrae]|uniref:Uncharacterized protein n=1 Tax=Methylocella tundrae TaxID=227605 RepID=A0A8B6MCT4_METTU|nr:hypothetical protein [Methylocella tundrae]VTZ27895.1 hypothetical protein MPC1_70005 [Methylocella tundrae]VTZ52495.1 hypothetical protein MPC4_80166 [Methylocella tundrae]
MNNFEIVIAVVAAISFILASLSLARPRVDSTEPQYREMSEYHRDAIDAADQDRLLNPIKDYHLLSSEIEKTSAVLNEAILQKLRIPGLQAELDRLNARKADLHRNLFFGKAA